MTSINCSKRTKLIPSIRSSTCAVVHRTKRPVLFLFSSPSYIADLRSLLVCFENPLITFLLHFHQTHPLMNLLTLHQAEYKIVLPHSANHLTQEVKKNSYSILPTVRDGFDAICEHQGLADPLPRVSPFITKAPRSQQAARRQEGAAHTEMTSLSRAFRWRLVEVARPRLGSSGSFHQGDPGECIESPMLTYLISEWSIQASGPLNTHFRPFGANATGT